MDCPFIRNPIDIEAVLIGNALRRERIFRPRLDVLSFPEEYLFQRYRFSSNSIIYLNNILRPYITNLTHCGRALTSEQTLCIAQRFFANGSFLYNIGDAEHYGKATVCRAVRKVILALKCLLPVMVVFVPRTQTCLKNQRGILQDCSFHEVHSVQLLYRKPLRWRVAGHPATLAPNVGLLRPGRDTEGLSKAALEPPAAAEDSHPSTSSPLNGSDGQRRSGEAAQRPPPATVCASLPRIQPGAAQASRPSARGPGAQGPMLQEEMGGACLVALVEGGYPTDCSRPPESYLRGPAVGPPPEPIQPAPAASYPRDTSASWSSSPRPPVSGTEGEGGVGV
ncbi:hypothetical protein N1851_028409 [Merluccius polli]|uniref:Uncharacterized protein n=1 Tax=Merluccius polli TaxID=89951 RepID=A0AA47M8Q4_MERPO|nr:hypothetical protein N1851_028409 [Merluccius polli]